MQILSISMSQRFLSLHIRSLPYLRNIPRAQLFPASLVEQVLGLKSSFAAAFGTTKRIVNILDDAFDGLATLQEAMPYALKVAARLDALKKSLLHQAFSGQL